MKRSVDDLTDEYEITTNGKHNISSESSMRLRVRNKKDILLILKIKIFNIKLKEQLKREELDKILKNLFFMS